MNTTTTTGLLALTLCFGLFGCDSDATTDPIVENAEPLVDSVVKDTDTGAFRVVLASSHGSLELGDNSLTARVGFPDPNVDGDLGIGVPDASVHMLVWMPLGEGAIEQELVGKYRGDGVYEFESFELEHAGVWQFDLGIEVGVTIRENVSFGFLVEE